MPLHRPSWIVIPKNSDFTLQNLPYGLCQKGATFATVTRVGDTVIDLAIIEHLLPYTGLLQESSLNAFCGLDPTIHEQIRSRLQELLSLDGDDALRSNKELCQAALKHAADVALVLPIAPGDVTDFYSNQHHATTVGKLFRPDNPLQPNWTQLPVAYHGRSSTVVLSGTPVVRPTGQVRKGTVAPTAKLDYELEVGTVMGSNGVPFGFVLLNDWSARDIQAWEYVPLGPFTAKNFCTSISQWIVTTQALQAFGVAHATSSKHTYLQESVGMTYPMQLSVHLDDQCVATTPWETYWSVTQQIAHHQVTGCQLQAGDLLGSGTISSESGAGCLLEATNNGQEPLQVGGKTKTFLEDGDAVVLKGHVVRDGIDRVGFGECSGTVLPADTVPQIVEPPPQRFTDFVLHQRWVSSASWRVRIFLAIKEVDYKIVIVEEATDEYKEKNPMGQVPLLQCYDNVNKTTICMAQSMAICQFLDTAFPHKPLLLPKDPVLLAQVIEMAELVNAGTQPLQNVVFLKDLEARSNGLIEFKDQARRAIHKGLTALEKVVATRHKEAIDKGPFCMATFAPTLADVFMVPQLANTRRFDMPSEVDFPLLCRIDKLCRELDSFRLTEKST